MIGRGDESLDVARAAGFAGPTAIVEYGLDRIFFHPEPEDGRRGEPASALTLGYVGRVVREKGLHDVLDAMAIARSPAVLHVMGDGPDMPALKGRAAALGLAARLRVVPPGPPAEVARFMGNIDVLVLMSRTTPTWKEQFGRVIMEAQGCGTPVIGSSSGSIPDVVGPGGWIVGEGDAAALGALLDRLAADPGAVKAARAAGLAQADDRFSFAKLGRALGRAMIDAAMARSISRAAA
jgi:glycosyltransferase involved in cell wall biosynthesis